MSKMNKGRGNFKRQKKFTNVSEHCGGWESWFLYAKVHVS
jgi:hypothetical protein